MKNHISAKETKGEDYYEDNKRWSNGGRRISGSGCSGRDQISGKKRYGNGIQRKAL